MEDKQDLFDKLIQIKDSYEPDPDLANKVIEKINQREATVEFKEPVPKWFWVVLACIVVATVAIFLSVYLTRPDIRITVYSAESIEFEEVENLENFISDNNLNIECFKDKFDRSSIAKIKETGAFAYVTQSFNDIGETGFDKLELKVVLLSNAEFEFYSTFQSLANSLTVSDTEIQYGAFDKLNSMLILAAFDFEDKSYFLEIQTNDSVTAVLEKYINQLLN